MRYLMAVAVAACVAFPATASEPPPYLQERVFTQAGELLHWCREEAESRYVAQGVPTYQWSGRYHERSNILYAEGTLRARHRNVAVECRVARNARERYAVIEIDDPEL